MVNKGVGTLRSIQGTCPGTRGRRDDKVSPACPRMGIKVVEGVWAGGGGGHLKFGLGRGGGGVTYMYWICDTVYAYNQILSITLGID